MQIISLSSTVRLDPTCGRDTVTTRLSKYVSIIGLIKYTIINIVYTSRYLLSITLLFLILFLRVLINL